MDKGAHFYRCDFQVHTPRDTNWSGAQATTAEQREQFGRALIQACRVKRLDAIAITDHHDFIVFPYVRAAAEMEIGEDGQPVPEERRIVVFPGLELTLGVPCQALLLLDADFPADRLPLVLEALAVEATDASAASLPSVTRLDHLQSLTDLYEALDSRSWLRNHYIVLPNVTDKGHGTLMRAGMQAKYKKMPSVGGYLDGTVETKVGDGNRRIFAGLDPNWGNRRIALVQTSDSRSESFTDLGKHSTWVKWAVPTAEAIRQACLAEESRISQKRPPMPGVYITRLSVSNSKFMGPIELELNQQYNAVIGGRGTGKSTILEYMRWGLCDQQRRVETIDELSDPAARQRRLIEQTLRPYNSSVDVHLLINGVAHVVRRSAQTGEAQIRVAGGEFERATEADVRSLLPVHAYSQKQLSSIAVRLDELTRFVTAPIQETLSSIDVEIEALATRIRQNYASLRRYRQLESSIARSDLALGSLSKQAGTVRASLEDLSEEDQQTLARKPSYDTASDLMAVWSRRLEQAVDIGQRFDKELDRLMASLPSAPTEELPNAAGLEAMAAEVRALIGGMKRSASEALATLQTGREPGSRFTELTEAWTAEQQAYEAKYAAVQAASSAHESKLAQLADLEQRQTATRRAVSEQREEMAQLGDPQAQHGELRMQWLALLKRRSDMLEARCREITNLSDAVIRAGVKRAGGLTAVIPRIRAAVSGSNLRTNKIDDLVKTMGEADDPLSSWEELLTELEASIRLTPDSDLTPTAGAKTLLLRYGLTAADINKLLDRLTSDSWLDLALMPIADEPYFEYMAKEGEYIDFSAASPGQQATALLRILLNQEGPPLIIDQPEDDLDSPVIQEIVAKIWTAKGKRQLIFSSHNANLVVNGDAELVVCCDYRAMGDHSGGRIKLEGAIDVAPVRNEITQIMEGGERAFRLRKDKYGF